MSNLETQHTSGKEGIGRIQTVSGLFIVDKKGNANEHQSLRLMPTLGVIGDVRFDTDPQGQITLITSEELDWLNDHMLQTTGYPLENRLLKRNVFLDGVNPEDFYALLPNSEIQNQGGLFEIGNAIFQVTGQIPFDTRNPEIDSNIMDLSHYGGLTARILGGGFIRIGDNFRII